eukprot:7387514-Prymnesium_polylepis.2
MLALCVPHWSTSCVTRDPARTDWPILATSTQAHAVDDSFDHDARRHRLTYPINATCPVLFVVLQENDPIKTSTGTCPNGDGGLCVWRSSALAVLSV